MLTREDAGVNSYADLKGKKLGNTSGTYEAIALEKDQKAWGEGSFRAYQSQNDTILALVAFAWAGFGATFGPAVLLSLFWRRLTAPGAMLGMVAGAVVVFTWQYTPWSSLYEIIPGFAVNLLVAIGVSLFTNKPEVDEEFAAARELAGAGRLGEQIVAR